MQDEKIWKVWNFAICDDICYVKGFNLMEQITVNSKLNTSQRATQVPKNVKIVESLKDFIQWWFYPSRRYI